LLAEATNVFGLPDLERDDERKQEIENGFSDDNSSVAKEEANLAKRGKVMHGGRGDIRV
jgi:hypothetical protein